MLTGFAAKSQCNNTAQFGTINAPTGTTPATITTCAFAGEYSTINNCVAGQTYLFSATGGAGNFITIRQGTPGGTVLGFGTSPVSVVCTVSGPLYLHYNTNASCGTDFACHTGIVQCTSCAAPPPIANDDCTGAIPITCGSATTGTTVGATLDAVPTCGTPLNTAPGVWYTFVGTGQLTTLNTCTGTSYDSKIGVFSGTCASLVCVAGNDDFCGVQSQVSFMATLGTTYYVLVTGFGTSSGAFTLTMSCAAAVANDDCTGALPLGCGATVTGTTVGATVDAVPTCVTSLNTAPGVWYSFVGNGAANTLTLCTGTSYDSKIGVFTGTCAALVCVTGNDDFCGLQSQVTFPTTLGTTYYVLITGFGTATGAFTLTRTSAPLPNDVCSGAITINCGQTITGSTSCGATPDAVPTCGTTLSSANGVWYQFVGDGSSVTLSLCGSSFDTKIGVFRGTCAALVCVTGNDDFCGLQSQVTFNTNAGFTYYILVTGFSTANGNFTLTRTCAPICTGVPSPGSITPTSSTVCIGNTVTLTCSGYPNNTGLTFQWNSAPAAAGPYTAIPGATSNVYTFTAASTLYYTCTVTCTNTGGGSSTTAPPVVVNVSNIQFSSAAITPTTVCSAGSSVTVTGTVAGGLNLGNYTYTLTGPGTIGAPVVSGTNNSSVSFTVTNIPAGAHVYTLTAMDPVPCSKSTTLNLTVNQTPVVTLVPASATICNGAIQSIQANVTTGSGTVVFSPVTELFTNAGATIAYTGTALASGTTIYAKPTVTRTYTATVTSAQNCSSTTPITITVNQLPAITVHPVAAASPICPGFNANYSVTATGTSLTYQWQLSTDNGTTWNNISNGPQYSGVTTNNLTVQSVTTGQNGNRFRCVVSGVCPPPATSNSVTLVVATAPTITTAPPSRTVCAGVNTTFTVVAGGVPLPTIYQWQVSTNSGGLWTNLTTGGSYTPSFTITGTTTAMSGNWYRVIVTNICGQSVTSVHAVLTVNALPVVTAVALPSKICLSDAPIALSGSPVGGTWSGIGVSGFNFVPAATSVGTYTLTYTFTNTLGCTNTATLIAKVEECRERIRLLRDNAVVLYPNPNSGNFNIRINSVLYNYMGMNVYSQSGQLVHQKTFNGLTYGSVVPINLTHLPSGIYMVKFFYDDGIRTSEKTFQVVIGRN